MQETGSNIQSALHIADESFRKEFPESYNLFVLVGDDTISAVVSEYKNKHFVALESWELDGSPSHVNEDLEKIITDSEILNISGYRQVVCCSAFRCSALVPAALFDQNSVFDQLHFSNRDFITGEILVDTLQQVEARNIFNVPMPVYQMMSSRYKNISFHHTSTALIEYLLSVNRNSDAELMTINVQKSYVEIVVINGKKLILYNTYAYASAEELVYYILFVCEQLHLNPDSIEVQFAGIVEATDLAYTLSSKYLRNIAMVPRPDHYSFSSTFNQIPDHLHFNLYSQLICAS